ncbi:ferritin heavy polypeptide-like 17 [Solenopsis invicta]|nr:ferritin heavy polypeptide-like 17 [Solenopsis invicta]XP_011160666.1 ferritin heavy polypeptide-like 17 [Solenopsis invicta]
MLFFGVLSILFLTVSAENCYNDVETFCSTSPKSNGLIPHCNAKYGHIDDLEINLREFAIANIEKSFEFLLMSTHFGNYEANREGFKGLYRQLSDKLWQDAIDLIKYITQRGGSMDINQLPHENATETAKDSSNERGKVVELTELNSLAKALESQKQLANEALRIHSLTQHHTKNDAAVAHYIEEHFMESLSERVRQLAGYSNDLKNMLKDTDDASLSVFLFDEYLQKTL